MVSFKPLIDGMFGPKGAIILAIDNILGYAGLRTYRKLFSAYFQANDVDGILANAPRIYREHYERVRRLVPPEQLLEYELGSGWEPLCEFLCKENPNAEFPWINEASALQKKMLSVMAARLRELISRYVWSLAWLVFTVALALRMLR